MRFVATAYATTCQQKAVNIPGNQATVRDIISLAFFVSPMGILFCTTQMLTRTVWVVNIKV